MDDRLCFVQFLHPGPEHWPDEGNTAKAWNTGGHGRKFVKSAGRYLAGDHVGDGDIVFWAEWEPESRVVARIERHDPAGPTWLYEPYYVPRPDYGGLQNTDPFVFGERFLYTACRQYQGRSRTQLGRLARGSVVLFGSCKGRRFVLDTVFVVAGWIDHDHLDHAAKLRGAIPEAHEQVTISPWYADPKNRGKTFRLYFGATADDPVGGMFSFVPCLPFSADTTGFPRPPVSLPGLITDTHYQGYKRSFLRNTDEATDLWREVVCQVTGRGLLLGIETAVPPAHTALQG